MPASAATRWWGRLSIRRKSRFPAGLRPKTGSTAMCCRYPASPLWSGSKASTISARTAMPREAGMKDVVGRTRAKFADVRIIGATLTSALGSTNANHGSPEEDAKRKALNEFIRNGGLFDGVADFDAATLDPQTGGMRAEFVPESTTGGPGDKIHPNRVVTWRWAWR